MRTFQMGYSRSSGGKSSKDKGFSSKGKIEKYNHDGTETIIVMGRPFRVLQKIGDGVNHAMTYKEHTRYKSSKDAARSYVFLVENVENLPEFPHHLALKRSFFNVDEVVMAHRELEILSRVKDKSIVRVYHSEVTRSDGKLGVTVAMEYCSNNLLRRLRQESRMPESEIVQVLLAVTSAVGYLHTQQPPIAHRDICPDNILIHSAATGAAAYRLCNFGSATTEAYECANREEIALAVEDIERHTTPAFRAPEMADPGSHKRIDERVDLWSIGVLLYYMMYLRLPFGETNMGLTGRLKLRYPPGTEMWYTSSLRVALEHLLEQDPEKRWDIFALTNFLRFDQDISKYIGTFFFTATEWPDGWEQQDVKVVNRPVPPKAPPLRVEGERHVSAAAAAEESNVVGGGRLQFVTRDPQQQQQSQQSQQQQTQRPSQRQPRSRTSLSSHGSGGELDAETLAALGVDAESTDPEMVAYREKLIREQEEAWRMAKAASGAGRRKKSEDTSTRRDGSDSNTTEKQQQQQQQQEEEEEHEGKSQEEKNDPSKEKKNDLFDDLFDSTPVTASSSSPVPPTASVSPQAPSQQFDGGNNNNNNNNNWQDSLFSQVPPQQQQQQPAAAAPQHVVMDDGWGTGAPTMVPGAYPMDPMYPTAQPQGTTPFNMQQQQQLHPQLHQQQQQLHPQLHQQDVMPPTWGGAGPNFAPQSVQQPMPMPPQQQQQQQPNLQQATMDFTKGSFPQQQQQPAATEPAKKGKKKDPFEDLFL
ncbi:protein kinase [Trypanosoma theileri]|uniref:non-specific serine/threonine protein kinase n=1 Tax=Trypanosoma theileri TaxID=67003 RepID=A0A1X0NUC1_9TRYP|nr:protein kinase [Trypanosoma theileri]ORC88138.1 protein kinase [Trypanosoma theileri]